MPLRGAQLIVKAVTFPVCSHALKLRKGLNAEEEMPPCALRDKESFLPTGKEQADPK